MRGVLDHERIIAKLDESAKLFNVVILKSTLAIPYTSVFLELDCGYWNANAEKRLRDSLAIKNHSIRPLRRRRFATGRPTASQKE